jgi:hypothetical protein
MVLDKSIIQKCFRNQDGGCHYRESDVVPCSGMCNFFVTFDKTICNQAKVIPVDRWEYEHIGKKKREINV